MAMYLLFPEEIIKRITNYTAYNIYLIFYIKFVKRKLKRNEDSKLAYHA
jgi:hypothetical protein